MKRASTAGAALVLAMALPAGASAQKPVPTPSTNPMDSIGKLPGYRPAHDTIPLLPPARIAALPTAQRRAWQAYLARSAALYTADTSAMRRELRAVGMTVMTRAPYAHDFSVKSYMTPAWFATETAQRMAKAILSYQAPNGGWSKHVDFTRGPRPAGGSYFAESNRWEWISTIDNDQTTSQMDFLARADRAHPDASYRAAFVRGLNYLLAAQYPNGCWPQVYPLEGSYHDAATFNDDATLNVLRVMHDAGHGAYAFVPHALGARAAVAEQRGIGCVLDAQAVVNGERTAWPQQSDPMTLAPTSARSYELTSIASRESAHLLDYLLTVPSPRARVVAAVHDAAAWLEKVPVHGVRYDTAGGLRAAPGAGRVWARMYEIGTNRPIFSNRDGIKLYDWDRLTDRRHGYGWYDYAPDSTLARYARWRVQHPRTGHSGAR